MPALLAPFVGALVGLLLAWTHRRELERAAGRDGSASATLAWTLGLSLLGPSTGWFLSVAPDWSLAYLVDPTQLHPFVSLALTLLAAASVPLGHALAAPAVRQRGSGALGALAAAIAVPAVAFALLAARRLGVDASYAQYHGDWAVRPLSSTPLGLAVLLVVVALLVALWLAHRGLSASRAGQRSR